MTVTGANAADIVEPIAAMDIPYSWTGFYVGANAGGAFGDIDGDFIGISGSADISNFTGGVLVGANYQYGQWVLGIEGDINYLGFKDEFSPGAGGLIAQARLDAFGTIRGRVGYAFDRWLPYVTAGVAMGNVKIDEFVFGATETKFQTGYAVGGGAEYAFNNNWSFRAEYLYIDLGKKDFGFDFIGGEPYNVKTNFSVVRAAIAYKF
ncbi:porin [Mesorhizobium sp. L2C066B000]|nr:porin [Mesorhizobium sp. L2C066B000]